MNPEAAVEEPLQSDDLLVENWYGFQKQPFHVTPDSAMVFTHRRYEEAFSALQYGISNGKGFIVITGEVGAGKTTLLRHFVNALGENMRCAVILNTGSESGDLLRSVAEDLEIKGIENKSGKQLLDAIMEYILAQYAEGRMVTVLIDEAQRLSFEALESIRMLSNLETENEKLLQIVLFGQPELEEKLRQPDLLQLRTRIAVTYHLCPMDLDETAAYITHRLAHGEPSRPVHFSPRAISRLHKYSGGSPRLINIICDQALLAAGTQQLETIDAALISSIIEGFAHLDRPPDQPYSWQWIRTPLIVLIVVAGAAFAYTNAPRPVPASPAPAPAPIAETFSPAATTASPITDFVASLGIPRDPAHELMTPRAIAAATGLVEKELNVSASTAQALGLPAILPPGNNAITNVYPAVIASVSDGTWTARTREQGEIKFPFREGSLALSYLVPNRPYMHRRLRKGLRGSDVESAQQLLVKAGLLRRGNGSFDAETRRAVMALQNRYGIRQDGVIGSETMLALYALEKSHGG